MTYKIQIQTPVIPNQKATEKLTALLRKIVKDKEAKVLFYTDRPGCDFYVTVLKNLCEQEDLAIDCQKALFNHFFSMGN